MNAGLKISFGVCNNHNLDRLSWSLQNDRNSGAHAILQTVEAEHLAQNAASMRACCFEKPPVLKRTFQSDMHVSIHTAG